jgi:hypothetical protein
VNDLPSPSDVVWCYAIELFIPLAAVVWAGLLVALHLDNRALRKRVAFLESQFEESKP